MRPCRCLALDPTQGLGYAEAHAMAARLRALGKEQVRCDQCGRYTQWVQARKQVATVRDGKARR